MGAGQAGEAGRLRRAVAAGAVLGMVAALAAASPARAAHRGGLAAPPGGAAVAGTISTVAGGPGGPGPGRQVAVAPCAVSFADGEVYVADGLGNFRGGVVRMVSPQTGRLTTVAGTGSAGPLGDGGPAASASVQPCQGAVGLGGGEVAVDHAGDLVIADAGGDRIRVVAHHSGTFYGQPMTAGDIYTVAGTGTGGFSGDGGPATAAELNSPDGVAVDHAGNLLIADTGNNRVRVVAESTGTFYGKPMTAGDIYTLAGTGTGRFSGDGGPATAAALNHPATVTIDRSFNLVIADSASNRIRVVAHRTGTFYGQPMKAGYIYTVAGDGTQGFSGDGGPATAAELGLPSGVAVDGAGNLVIADSANHRVRVVTASTGTFYGQPMTARDIYTIAGTGHAGFSGDGGPATAAELADPFGVAVDGAGNLLIADTNSSRIRVVAASTGTFYGQPMTAGDIYTIAGGNRGFSGDGGPATAAQLSLPDGVAVDGAGNVLIADTFNGRIRVVAASTGTYYGQPMTAGDIYTIAGGGASGLGDGGPATAAQLNLPAGAAVDGAGNLLIADTYDNRIRVVAASTGTFYRQPTTAGDIYTIAGTGTGGFSGDGSPATAAELYTPFGVAVDAAGNLLIADTSNERIRVVAASTGTFYGQPTTAGDIYTIAGTGTGGFSGDGSPATAAELYTPSGVAVDAAGNLFITDTANNRIREVTG